MVCTGTVLGDTSGKGSPLRPSSGPQPTAAGEVTANSGARGTELAVVAWIQTSNNPSQTVRTVKIGHHGASDSTAGAMIRAFQPRKLILQSNTRDYGHPRMCTRLPTEQSAGY